MKIEIEKPVIPQFVADWIEQLYGQWFNSDDLLEVLFSRNYEVAELKIFDWFTDDKGRAVTAILYGYEVEKEPLYYAKIKGCDILDIYFYWVFYPHGKYVTVAEEHEYGGATDMMTKEEWSELGVNDTNADFEVVSE